MLIGAKCVNPIFFFDELDKVSQSDYGKELIDGFNDLTDKDAMIQSTINISTSI